MFISQKITAAAWSINKIIPVSIALNPSKGICVSILFCTPPECTALTVTFMKPSDLNFRLNSNANRRLARFVLENILSGLKWRSEFKLSNSIFPCQCIIEDTTMIRTGSVNVLLWVIEVSQSNGNNRFISRKGPKWLEAM